MNENEKKKAELYGKSVCMCACQNCISDWAGRPCSGL